MSNIKVGRYDHHSITVDYAGWIEPAGALGVAFDWWGDAEATHWLGIVSVALTALSSLLAVANAHTYDPAATPVDVADPDPDPFPLPVDDLDVDVSAMTRSEYWEARGE